MFFHTLLPDHMLHKICLVRRMTALPSPPVNDLGLNYSMDQYIQYYGIHNTPYKLASHLPDAELSEQMGAQLARDSSKPCHERPGLGSPSRSSSTSVAKRPLRGATLDGLASR